MSGKTRASWAAPGVAIRRAREAAGLTQRQLARAVGVSPGTLAAVELGADPRHSTLVGCLMALPSLSPRDLLPGEGPVPPVNALSGAWVVWRRVFGMSAEEMSLSLEVQGAQVRETYVVRGARSHWGSPRYYATRDSLVRAVVRAEAATLEALSRDDEKPLPPAWRATDGMGTHGVTASPTGVVDYQRDAVRPLGKALARAVDWQALGAGLRVRLPVERLEVQVRLAAPLEGAPPILQGRADLKEGVDVTGLRSLLPAAAVQVSEDGREIVATVSRPMPSFRYELAPAAPAHAAKASSRRPARRQRVEARDPILPAERAAVASVLAGARTAAQLSQRALGRRLGLSWVAVRGTELGADPRVSTLERYSSAFPELGPEDLLAGGRALSVEELWHLQARAMGVLVDDHYHQLVIHRDGSGQMFNQLRNVRSTRGGMVSVGLGYGMTARMGAGPRRPPSRQDFAVASSSSGTRVLGVGVERDPRRPSVKLTRLSARGATLIRRYASPITFLVRPADIERRLREAGNRLIDTQSVAPSFPAASLRLVVHFPPGFWPGRSWAHAWPVDLGPPIDDPLGRGPFPVGLVQAQADQRTGVVTLHVRWALAGMRYLISWEPPY